MPRISPLLTLVPAVFVALALAACGGDDDEPEPTRPPDNVTATAAPATSTPTGFPRVDGTVDPLGFGGTDPQTIKANPDPPSGVSVLRDVRVGAHPEEGGWDRIVFEFKDTLPAGTISYQPAAVGCGSGEPIPVQGQAILIAKFQPAQAHDDAGNATVKSTRMAGPGNAFVEARSICDFEADVQWAIGVKSMQRFKVTRLSNPTRVVIDIKW